MAWPAGQGGQQGHAHHVLGILQPTRSSAPAEACTPAPLRHPCSYPQGTDYTTVCLDAERPTRMLLGASMDRSGNEWVSAHSLEVETLLVGVVKPWWLPLSFSMFAVVG